MKRAYRSDYRTAGGDEVSGVIEDESLAGTGSKLGLVKFDCHRIIADFGERAGVGIYVGADFAEEARADNKLIRNNNV